jgi:hypothetical protein
MTTRFLSRPGNGSRVVCFRPCDSSLLIFVYHNVHTLLQVELLCVGTVQSSRIAGSLKAHQARKNSRDIPIEAIYELQSFKPFFNSIVVTYSFAQPIAVQWNAPAIHRNIAIVGPPDS